MLGKTRFALGCAAVVALSATFVAPAMAAEGPLPGPLTASQKSASGAPASEDSVCSSDTGSHVAYYQKKLNQASNAGLSTDGVHGPLTDTAVRAHQSGHGLQVDGCVGRQTHASLAKATASGSSSKSAGADGASTSGGESPSKSSADGNKGADLSPVMAVTGVKRHTI